MSKDSGYGVANPAEWTKLTSLPSKYEADLLAGRLRQQGIRSRIVKSRDDPAGWLKAYGDSSGFFDMYVPAAERNAARRLLIESSSPRSSRVLHPNHRFIHLIGRALLVLSMLSIVVVFLVNVLK
jgi:hypothetical protein